MIKELRSDAPGVYPIPLPRVFISQTAAAERTSNVLEIPAFNQYLSHGLLEYMRSSHCVPSSVEEFSTAESSGADEHPPACINLICQLYDATKDELKDLLELRRQDREFFDQRTRACYDLNTSLSIEFSSGSYRVAIGQQDSEGRIPVGPAAHLSSSSSYDHNIERYGSQLQDIPGDVCILSDLSEPNRAMWLRGQLLPSHICELGLFLYHNWNSVQKPPIGISSLESEEEARYFRRLIEKAEFFLSSIYPSPQSGPLRLIVFIDNMRAMYRVQEIINELRPYDTSAALHWNMYVASCSRFMKEDPNIYRSCRGRRTLTDTTGNYGGVNIEYVLTVVCKDKAFRLESDQISIISLVKEVLAGLEEGQGTKPFLVRNISENIRIAFAVIEAHHKWQNGDRAPLQNLIESLLDEKYRAEVSLPYIAATGPSESSDRDNSIRNSLLNCLRSLARWLTSPQYKADGTLADFEVNRWYIWTQIHRNGVDKAGILATMHELLQFLKDTGDASAYTPDSEKWYLVSKSLLTLLLTATKPAERSMQILWPFTLRSIRESADPWAAVQQIDNTTFCYDLFTERFCGLYALCNSISWASTLARCGIIDPSVAKKLFFELPLEDIVKINDTQSVSIESCNAERKQIDLWSKVSAAMSTLGYFRLHTKVTDVLVENHVPGCSIAICCGSNVTQTVCLGDAIRGTTPVHDHTIFEVASLSKAVASCFSMEYFRKRKIPLTTPANQLLDQFGSSFRIQSDHPDWGSAVTLSQLMNHTALNMHYVNGIPLSDPMPDILSLLHGNDRFGYAPVRSERKPGEVFQYSGGGFLVLQHIIEIMEGKNIAEITASFIADIGMDHFTFEQHSISGLSYACGYQEDGTQVESGRKAHPAFAAGGMGTPKDMQVFLNELTAAFQDANHRCPISHDTAIEMLDSTDKGSMRFMGAKIGAGIFVAEAGPNRIVIHQGANEGFRSLFAHCYHGPDIGKGFTIFCNSEFNSVLAISKISQLLFHEMSFQGIDESKYLDKISVEDIPVEQRVNWGYKTLVFDAFKPDNAERIFVKGPKDPWAEYNLAVGGTVIECTNQRFARAENLLSSHLPIFEPKLFGRQGKVMDSWESVRHNPLPHDTLIFELARPSVIHFASISTKYHNGNQAQAIIVEGRSSQSDPWTEIVPRVKLEGHSKLLVTTINDPNTMFNEIRVLNIPDGGISRLGLYNTHLLPPELHSMFASHTVARCEKFPDSIPHTAKPLAPRFEPSDSEKADIWNAIPVGWEVDLASSVLGGGIASASDEHYGPASQIVSPFPPLSMFDGLESARSREAGHFEDVVVKLGTPTRINRIEIDMTYFVNNNPLDASIHARGDSSDEWKTLVPRRRLKGYAGNCAEFLIESEIVYTHVRVVTYPDGGFNRLRVFGMKH